jgi:hypothetical protein
MRHGIMLFSKQNSKISSSLVRPRAIPYKHTRSIISPLFSLGIEYLLKPLQANIGVGKSKVR